MSLPKTCFVWTEGKQLKKMCVLDINQARTVLELLDQDRQDRIELGRKLFEKVDEEIARGGNIKFMTINVAVKSPGGVYQGIKHPLPGRVLEFLMYPLATDNQSLLDVFKAQLREFIFTGKWRIYKPKMHLERPKPIKIQR